MLKMASQELVSLATTSHHQPSDHDHDVQHHVLPGGGGGGESVDRLVVVGGRVATGGVAEYVGDHLRGTSLDLWGDNY